MSFKPAWATTYHKDKEKCAIVRFLRLHNIASLLKMLGVGLVAVCLFPTAALRSHCDALTVLQAINSDAF